MTRHLLTAAILTGLIVALVIATEIMGVRLYSRIALNLCIALILVLGLQVFMGNSGILSFAHIGFMGIGAYTTAVLTIPAQMKGMALPDLYPFLVEVQLSPYLGILIGGLTAALVAAAVSYPLMRLSDAAAVITSFALLMVLHTVMTNWSVLTNGPRPQSVLQRMGFAQYFDAVVSVFGGVKKPAGAAFEAGLEELGAEPETTAYVGDSLLNDVQGALSAGLVPIWIDRFGDGYPLPDGAHRIEALSELPELLATLAG